MGAVADAALEAGGEVIGIIPEALARAGNLEEARLAFEKMHTYANHLGLYSEEIGPSGESLGNFPQAFTHLSLVSAALYLDRALDNHRARVR